MSWSHGFISGATAAFAVWPFETIRTQKQVLNKTTFSNRVQHIYRKQGLTGFYKGLSHGMTGMGMFFALYFPIHGHLKKQYIFRNSEESAFGIRPFLASYIAANISSVFNNVFFVIRTRRQTQVTMLKPSINSSIFGVMKTEGIKGLIRGLGITCIKNIEFGFIVPFRQYMKDKGFDPLPATFTAKLITTSITYPLDTARTLCRYSTKPLSGKQIVLQFYKSPKSAYKGYSLYILRSVPSTAIAFTTYDWLESY